MKIFINALKVLLVLLLGLLLIAFLLPKQYEVQRSVVINTPPSAVFEQVADFNNYLKWNVWSKMDGNAKNIITGIPKTVGSAWQWEGKEIGQGGLTIKKIVPNEMIEYELMFVKPMQTTAKEVWTFEAINEGKTKVTWTDTGDLSFPVNRFMGLFIDKMLGGQFAEGLQNLKILCEQPIKE